MKSTSLFSRASIAATLIAGIAVVALASASQDSKSAAAQPAQAQSGPASDPLKLLEPYIGGEWHCTGAWSTGEKLVARETFTWGVGKKFVNVKTYVTGPEGEYQRYEGVYGVKDGKFTGWSFAYDGISDTTEWTIDGNRWYTAKTHKSADGGEYTIHQSVELVAPDKFHWLLEMEQNGTRSTMFDGYWVRQSRQDALAR